MISVVKIDKIHLFAGLVICSAIILSACSSSEKEDQPTIEYYGTKTRTGGLVVPPDLTQTDPSKNIRLPDSEEVLEGTQGNVLSNSNVLAEPGNVQMKRDGQQRWLVVTEQPSVVWPQLIEFWEKDGIELVTANPQSGVIETDWLINYADMTSSAEKLLFGLLNKLTESGQRDKYRIRIDFGEQPETTDVFVSHQGLEEVAMTASTKQVPDYKWVPRPADPGLEIAVMRQIMIYLGVDEDVAAQMTEEFESDREEHAWLLIEDTDEPVLMVDDGFARAWQRVGLALDRSGYTIFGRNREQGGYVVELADPDVAKEEKPGFFGRLFGADEPDMEDINFRIQVRLIPQTDEKTAVAIATEEGAHDNSETAISMLEQLYEQLR